MDSNTQKHISHRHQIVKRVVNWSTRRRTDGRRLPATSSGGSVEAVGQDAKLSRRLDFRNFSPNSSTQPNILFMGEMEGHTDLLPDGVCCFNSFVANHKEQLVSSSVPTLFWETVHNKLNKGVFDAGEVFQIVQIQESEDDVENDGGVTGKNIIRTPKHSWKVVVIKDTGVDCEDPMQIFLVDHAWTYRSVSDARTNLQEIPNLLERMAALMDVDISIPGDKELAIENILREMWRYNSTYSVRSPSLDIESSMPIWYVMDEFGSRIQHSSDPSFRVVPFFHSFSQTSYTLLFPIRSLSCGDEVTRNFIEGPLTDDLTERALQIPWAPCDMTSESFDQSEPPAEFYKSYRNNETFTEEDGGNPETSSHYVCPPDRKLRVFTQYEPISANLKHPKFEVVSEGDEEADILWLTQHFKDFKGLKDISPKTLINQFPYEIVVTIKDLLCVVCRRAAKNCTDPTTLETEPKWLPTTYNLKTELPQFVSYFQHRAKSGLDNHWICKPWNLARGLDSHITDNLNYILRLPSTGPKVACKYVEDPVLFTREDIGAVKFDIRYIVLLSSAKPLKLYAYQRFWLRFANRPFSLDHLDDYEKHFTVMNYRNTNLQQMFCHDFIKSFESQYTDIKYEDVERDIFKMLKEVFEGATSFPPPQGIAPSSQSRAMYGVDLMLKWSHQADGTRRMQPMLLEINWTPDCTRACQYYPEFFDDIFSVLFLDETEGRHCTLLDN